MVKCWINTITTVINIRTVNCHQARARVTLTNWQELFPRIKRQDLGWFLLYCYCYNYNITYNKPPVISVLLSFPLEALFILVLPFVCPFEAQLGNRFCLSFDSTVFICWKLQKYSALATIPHLDSRNQPQPLSRDQNYFLFLHQSSHPAHWTTLINWN